MINLFGLAASAHTVETTIDEYPGVSGITTARDAMRNLSEEDKDKIAAQVGYCIVFKNFSKWHKLLYLR